MLLSVVGYSTIPLLFDHADNGNDPFLLNAVIRVALVVTILGYLFATAPGLLADAEVRRLLRRRSKGWIFALAALGPLDYGFFAWATHFVDTTIVVIVYEMWPLPFMFLMLKLVNSNNPPASERRSFGSEIVALVLLAAAGFVLVTFASAGGFAGLGTVSGIAAGWGILLAVAAAGFASLAAFSFRWASDARSEIPEPGSGDSVEAALNLVCFVAVSVPALAANLVLSFVDASDGNSLTVSAVVLGLAIGVVAAVAGILFRLSNTFTTTPAMNAMFYLKPVLALVILVCVTDVEVARGDLAALGACAIVAANLLIHVDAGTRRVLWSRATQTVKRAGSRN